MLINLSNHPQAKWDNKQLEAANKQYGSIFDIPFPNIDPSLSTNEVALLATEYFNKIVNIFDECTNEPFENAVHIQGEFTFVFQLVTMLKQSGISCVASTSNRMIREEGNKKIIEFNFVQFRVY
jgi:hypothetical protein